MSHAPSELPPEIEGLLRLDDGDGPAVPLARTQADALVRRVMTGWQAAPVAVAPPRRRARALLVAAVLLAAGSAAAFFVAERVLWPDAPEAARQASRDHAARGATTPQPEAETAGEPAVEDTGDPRTRVTQDLLARANRLRAAGRYREAADTYLDAAQRAPSASLAQVAQVAAADLELERLDRAQRALALYRAALAAEGPLSREARAGSARALRALGDRQGEREALQGLERAHPGSPEAGWARERLDALDPH